MSDPQYVVTQAIAKALKYPTGYLLHECFQVKCAGTPGTDANGLPIVTDRHLIATLGSHLPGTQAHAIGNAEFDDSLWTIDAAQTAIDWSNPVCQVCKRSLAP